jgi:hypothetical protein
LRHCGPLCNRYGVVWRALRRPDLINPVAVKEVRTALEGMCAMSLVTVASDGIRFDPVVTVSLSVTEDIMIDAVIPCDSIA